MRTIFLFFGCTALGAAAFLACGGEALVVADRSDGGTDAGTSSSSASSSGSSSSGGSDPGACCPRTPVVTDCMQLGGSATNTCVTTCHFPCATNWRVERDETGCELWRYDTPKGENAQCVAFDAGASTLCTPACNGAELCKASRTVGGAALPPPTDGGSCPPGTHVENGSCLSDWNYACVPTPSACGTGPITCLCAGSLCTATSALCVAAPGAQIGCEVEAP